MRLVEDAAVLVSKLRSDLSKAPASAPGPRREGTRHAVLALARGRSAAGTCDQHDDSSRGDKIPIWTAGSLLDEIQPG
jgi:hypothetical protein